VNIHDAGSDRDRFYIPTDGGLVALDRSNGRIGWEASLPVSFADGNYHVHVGRHAVLLVPKLMASQLNWATGWTTDYRPMGLFWWVGRVIRLLEMGAGSQVPLVLLDPETGNMLKELSVVVVGPQAFVRWQADRVVVVSTGQMQVLAVKK
jgi:hypothetical protein